MSRRKARCQLYALVVGAGMAFGTTAVVAGVSSSLAGSWSGGGAVTVGGAGIKETARCKANYQQVSTSTYRLEAICATPSGRATQTATLRLVTGTTYQGNFHNPDYNVTGTIKVIVDGDRQTVFLTSDAGDGQFELRR